MSTRPNLSRRGSHGCAGTTASRARCILSRVTRWPSGWNVDRHKRDDDDQDRIKRDFRDVETPTPPLLYTLLVHVRSPSVVNRPTGLRTISVPSNGSADPWRNLKCSESLPEPPVAPETLQQMSSWHGHPMQSEADIVLRRGCSPSPSSGCRAAAILRINERRGRRERSCVAGSLRSGGAGRRG